MIYTEKARKLLYANSPYDLCSEEDDAYRNGVDATLDLINQVDISDYLVEKDDE